MGACSSKSAAKQDVQQKSRSLPMNASPKQTKASSVSTTPAKTVNNDSSSLPDSVRSEELSKATINTKQDKVPLIVTVDESTAASTTEEEEMQKKMQQVDAESVKEEEKKEEVVMIKEVEKKQEDEVKVEDEEKKEKVEMKEEGAKEKEVKEEEVGPEVEQEAIEVEAPASESIEIETTASESVEVETMASKSIAVEAPVSESIKVEAPASESIEVERSASESIQVEAPASEAIEMEAPAPEAIEVEAPAPEAIEVEAPAPEAIEVEAPEPVQAEDPEPEPELVEAAAPEPAPEQALAPSTNPCLDKLKASFPKALTNKELVTRVTDALKDHDYGDTTLLATSLCCDEVNRVLEKEFRQVYKHHFSMGGLAGFPFGGVTSFGAMAHHIPDGGSCLIVYGPHVGIDSNGHVGMIDRRGRKNNGACCGSAADAANHVAKVRSGDSAAASSPVRPLDAQQSYVRSMLIPYGRRLAKAEEEKVELPLVLYEAMDDMMRQIVTFGAGEVAGEGKIALLGGIQINTPGGMSDYFLPMSFEIRDNTNLLLEDLMWW